MRIFFSFLIYDGHKYLYVGNLTCLLPADTNTNIGIAERRLAFKVGHPYLEFIEPLERVHLRKGSCTQQTPAVEYRTRSQLRVLKHESRI